MTMLPRLKPANFYDLVIEVAIVRPGPIQGDMVHPYLRRRQGVEKVVYPSPAPGHGAPDELEQVLGRTLGVPLFQEQAMKIAIVAAGFTPGEADRLRRAMATFKRVGTIKTFQDKMVEGMVSRGYDRNFAERCFHQIEGFGEYGFPESHAASFALLVYASAWLKCHYPDVFCAALLNSQPMGFYAPAQIVRDAIRHGVAVHPPDINLSDWDSELEGEEDADLEVADAATSPPPPLRGRASGLGAAGGGAAEALRPEGRGVPRQGLADSVVKAGRAGEVATGLDSARYPSPRFSSFASGSPRETALPRKGEGMTRMPRLIPASTRPTPTSRPTSAPPMPSASASVRSRGSARRTRGRWSPQGAPATIRSATSGSAPACRALPSSGLPTPTPSVRSVSTGAMRYGRRAASAVRRAPTSPAAASRCSIMPPSATSAGSPTSRCRRCRSASTWSMTTAISACP